MVELEALCLGVRRHCVGDQVPVFSSHWAAENQSCEARVVLHYGARKNKRLRLYYSRSNHLIILKHFPNNLYFLGFEMNIFFSFYFQVTVKLLEVKDVC